MILYTKSKRFSFLLFTGFCPKVFFFFEVFLSHITLSTVDLDIIYVRKNYVLRKVIVIDICLEQVYKFDKSLFEIEIFKSVFKKYSHR